LLYCLTLQKSKYTVQSAITEQNLILGYQGGGITEVLMWKQLFSKSNLSFFPHKPWLSSSISMLCTFCQVI